jgi:hypothetical protein
MNYFILTLQLLLLGIVVYQDFKLRLISWVLIPLLFVLQSFISYKALPLETSLFYFIINVGFIGLQLICLTLYFSIKNKRFTNIVNSYLGIGDILFFFILCMSFSPVNFILFYLGSILMTLIGFIFYSLIHGNKEIPLAGAMALCLIVCFVFSFLNKDFSFYNDCLSNK